VRPQPEFAALQAALAPDEAFIYHYLPDRETLLIYVITPTAIAVEQHILGEIRARLDLLADDISALEGETGWLEADIPPLGVSLLPQDTGHLLDDTRRLLISPHRILHHLPLHSLDWHGAPLIERFAVSYLPNAASLLLPRSAAPSLAILSVGIEAFLSPLPDLPGAEREADDIAAIYRQAGADATVLLGADASRARFEQLQASGSMERFSVIHLATHGENLPTEEPNEAALHLADGPVDAMDISQWTLHADLVSLSACWSGRRPVHARRPNPGSPDRAPSVQAEELFGDEVYGLQSAFFAGGARQILGSLWPLDNGSGPAVMRSFHAGISRSQPPDIALQAAINQQRRAGRSIYHWAPYKLITLGRPATEAADARRSHT
jgi:CHAT domain-containing protein